MKTELIESTMRVFKGRALYRNSNGESVRVITGRNRRWLLSVDGGRGYKWFTMTEIEAQFNDGSNDGWRYDGY